jgi:hypothetical protein
VINRQHNAEEINATHSHGLLELLLVLPHVACEKFNLSSGFCLLGSKLLGQLLQRVDLFSLYCLNMRASVKKTGVCGRRVSAYASRVCVCVCVCVSACVSECVCVCVRCVWLVYLVVTFILLPSIGKLHLFEFAHANLFLELTQLEVVTDAPKWASVITVQEDARQ